jgi:hypothetical protein
MSNLHNTYLHAALVIRVVEGLTVHTYQMTSVENTYARCRASYLT